MLSPLVVTLELDDASQGRFDGERAALFPPGRTQVGAHVTLFHAVPGDFETAVRDDLTAATARVPFDVRVDDLMPLGRGVAYHLRSAELATIHARLQQAWWSTLTRQDQQGLRAHVTVQNKVTPQVAKTTLGALRAAFVAFDATATGLRLWRYDGGPWTPLARFTFDAPP